MSLINQTNEEYYAGEKVFAVLTAPQTVFTCTFEPDLNISSPTENANFDVKVSTDLGVTWATYVASSIAVVNDNKLTPPFNTNIITLGVAVANSPTTLVKIGLKAQVLWDNYGSYEYIKLNDVINNFLIAYVGPQKLIPSVKRTDLIFHAKRGLQEFSYDTLNSIKSLEVTLPPSLSIPIPQDYVNYVRLSWVDDVGVLHPIYPANTLTNDPTDVPLQSKDGSYIQDNFGENTEAADSTTRERWKKANDRNLTGEYQDYYYGSNVYDWSWRKESYGRRYGQDPVISQSNGWYSIDRRRNVFSFSSNITDRLIIIEYISDGLASDLDTKLPKMAEEAMYMHIAYSILAGRANVPEYIVQRFKRDRSAQLRNAKIRLSNMKIGEMIQNMRGKSKWLKF
jgi:hypothetical protein